MRKGEMGFQTTKPYLFLSLTQTLPRNILRVLQWKSDILDQIHKYPKLKVENLGR